MGIHYFIHTWVEGYIFICTYSFIHTYVDINVV